MHASQFDEVHCPQTSHCGEGQSSFSLGRAPCYVGIAFDSLSCIATVAMVLIYIAWKDIRKRGAQSIVTFIAIADFFTAAAYLASNVNVVAHYNETDVTKCETFRTFCETMSFIVTTATMSSYMWTMILALYFYLVIARSKMEFASKLMSIYHVVAWGIPVAIAFPLLCTGTLPYAPFVGGVWCYLDITDNFHTLPPFSQKDVLVAVVVKLPEIAAYLLILILYSITRLHIYKQVRYTGSVNASACMPITILTCKFSLLTVSIEKSVSR